MPQSVAVRLADAKLLLTGASGFLGKAVLATWLREVPGSGTITLLLRAPDDDAAHQRLVEQVLTSEPFAGGLADEALASGRLRALAADLAAEGLGGLDSQELAGTDVVIHCAASVSFEQPLDEILELNGLGARRLLRRAARGRLRRPHLAPRLHRLRRRPAHRARARAPVRQRRRRSRGLDLDAELAVAKAWRRDLEAESRLPEHQKRFVADAPGASSAPPARRTSARAPSGGATAGSASELVERGAPARTGARLVGHLHALQGARRAGAACRAGRGTLTIVRPSIVESALEHALPGLDGGAEGRRPDPARLRRGLIPPLPRPTVGADRHRAGRPRRQRLRGRRGATRPTDGPRCLTMASGARNPLTHRRARADHHPRTSASARCPTRTACRSRSASGASRSHANIRRALDRGEQAAGRRAARSSPARGCPRATTSSCACTSSSAGSTACAA